MKALAQQLVKTGLEQAISAGELDIDRDAQAALIERDLGVERPKDKTHGDWASSVALRLAKKAHMAPRDIAEIIAGHIKTNDKVQSVEVAGPGFINLRLSAAALQSVFADVRSQDKDYGKSNFGAGTKIDLEFISANPTGPMHLGHGRWAALGDAIARVLAFCGFDVCKEFYINDAGSQMDKFANSVVVRYLQITRLIQEGVPAPSGTTKDGVSAQGTASSEQSSQEQAQDAQESEKQEGCSPCKKYDVTLNAAIDEIMQNSQKYRDELPKDCYAGAYIIDIAADIYNAEGDKYVDMDEAKRQEHFKEVSYRAVLQHVKEVLAGFGLEFDLWFSERDLHKKDKDGTSEISRVIKDLDAQGFIYKKEDATWFKTTEFGDDKDRVVQKADGSYTYFAPDIAYHKNKFDRGFDRCIDILGADHHGYIKRIQSVGAVFGKPGQPEVVIGQLVNLFRDGKAVRMSKRTGEMVTFEELLDEVGSDSLRYTMLNRSTDQQIDFDITQAKRQDSSNPVYYVQYAHARICSILRKAANVDDVDADPKSMANTLLGSNPDLSVLSEEAELDVARKISEFSEVVTSAAKDLAPHRLTYYCYELASVFTQFYTKCHVLGVEQDLQTARLAICDACRIVLENALNLLGISAPKHM